MVQRPSLNSKKNAKGPDSTVSKGKIVEHIAALMHEQSGVTVERNRFLSPVSGEGKKREIDILLTCSIAGYPVQMAIECKNEKNPIDSPKIDAFVGKLQHVGIPPQYGIYVSASGYTKDAIKRAKTAGMRTLTLRGLTDENLLGSIADAFQSAIYLLLQVKNMTLSSTAPPANDFAQIGLLRFYNGEEKLAAEFPDLIWQMWRAGQLPNALGEHKVDLPLPSNLHQKVNGRVVETLALKANVWVIGLVVTLKGTTKEYTLVNAGDETVERILTDVSFEASESRLPVTAIASEDQLQAFLRRPGAVQLTLGRMRLPRIVCKYLYWPPSERVMKILKERWQAFEAGELSELPEFTLQELEGPDLQTIWEPIWEEHPAHQWMKEQTN
jgi:Restriction endonuclease